MWPTELCGGRIKEQQLCLRSSQLNGVWRPQRAKSLRLNLSFSPAAGSGIWQCAPGKGVSLLQLLGLFWAYIITSQHIVVVSSSWQVFGASSAVSSRYSGKGGKVKCWVLPKGKNCSRSYLFYWECIICFLNTCGSMLLFSVVHSSHCFVLVSVERTFVVKIPGLATRCTNRGFCQKYEVFILHFNCTDCSKLHSSFINSWC